MGQAVESADPAQHPASPRTLDPCPSVGRPCPSAAESQREEQSGPVLRNFTTSEIWLVDATDWLEEEEEEDEEGGGRRSFLRRPAFSCAGMLLSLAGGRKAVDAGCQGHCVSPS